MSVPAIKILRGGERQWFDILRSGICFEDEHLCKLWDWKKANSIAWSDDVNEI